MGLCSCKSYRQLSKTNLAQGSYAPQESTETKVGFPLSHPSHQLSLLVSRYTTLKACPLLQPLIIIRKNRKSQPLAIKVSVN